MKVYNSVRIMYILLWNKMK